MKSCSVNNLQFHLHSQYFCSQKPALKQQTNKTRHENKDFSEVQNNV